MNITCWSNLIYSYYYERNEGSNVILHISMQDLVDYAKDKCTEIAQGKYANEFSDDFVRNDFVRKFWIKPNGNDSLKDLQSRINQIIEQAKKDDNYVILLSVIALLSMANIK